MESHTHTHDLRGLPFNGFSLLLLSFVCACLFVSYRSRWNVSCIYVFVAVNGRRPELTQDVLHSQTANDDDETLSLTKHEIFCAIFFFARCTQMHDSHRSFVSSLCTKGLVNELCVHIIRRQSRTTFCVEIMEIHCCRRENEKKERINGRLDIAKKKMEIVRSADGNKKCWIFGQLVSPRISR